MNKTTAWKCEFCNKYSGNAGAMKKHEQNCKKNPAKKHCRGCVHGISAILGWHNDLDNNPTVPDYGPFCAKHDKPIHEKPYMIDCEIHGGGYFENYPVPWTCEHYKFKGSMEWTPEQEYEADE